MPSPSITLYGLPLSGHCHRVELLLRMLKLPFHYEVVSRSDLSSAAFLALNPLGQIPVLKDGNLILPDSNAILVYLATEYDDARVWYPVNPVIAAHIQRWLSLAAGEVRFGPAMARAVRLRVRQGDLEAVAVGVGSDGLGRLGMLFLCRARPRRRDRAGTVSAYSCMAGTHRSTAGIHAYAALASTRVSRECASPAKTLTDADRIGELANVA